MLEFSNEARNEFRSTGKKRTGRFTMKHPKSLCLPVSHSSPSSAPPSPISSSNSSLNADSDFGPDSDFSPRSVAANSGHVRTAGFSRPSHGPRFARAPVPARVDFVELLARSNFSFLQGASHPEEIVLRAKVLGYRGLAICDVNGLYGVVRGYQAAEKPSVFDAEQLALMNADGTPKEPFRYLLGAELTPCNSAPITLMPMNKDGYVRLCHLITLAKRRAPKGHIVLSLDDILRENEDLLAFALPPWKEATLKRLQEAFQDRLYLPVCKDLSWEAIRCYQQALGFERSLGLQLFATQRPLFHEPGRKPLHDVLTCILHKTTLDEAATRLTLNRERYLKPPGELAISFRERPDLIARTLEIAARVEFSLSELRYRYPRETLPNGKNATDFLLELVQKGIEWRYPPSTPADFMAKVRRQVDYELALIAEMEYEDYFLTLWDICQFARSQNILHQGRGSAANSIICFALGLTSVDPIKLGLLFERFISRERAEPPDIDIDFEHERREEVIQYIYRKYGERHAAMVCTVITYRSRMAIREAAKVMGVPLEQIGELIKYMGREGLSRLVDIAVERGLETPVNQRAPRRSEIDHGSRAPVGPHTPTPERELERVVLSRFGLDTHRFQKLLHIALEMQGFPRHIGIHSGGFVIANEPVIDIVPVEAATMEGRHVIQWNKDDINILGLMKIDVLSLGMLTAVRRSLDLLRSHCGIDWGLADVPHDDPGTYKMIQAADTVGVFQIESRAQMSILPRLKPRNYYDLVIEVAIVRPGPIQGGMIHPYLRRRAGREKITYAHDSLKPILQKTLGIPLFQEQVMQIAVIAANFTPGEADELRRVVSSAWRKKRVMHGLRQRVIGGMLSNGLTQAYAEQIYKTIEGFASYGFPESHAASFALITYVSCYLKYQHPDIFVCALLNSQPMGFYSPRQLVADAQRHGVEFRSLDVQFSQWDYTLEKPHGDAAIATNRTFIVRVGFRSVHGLREEHVRTLVNARDAGGPFADLGDLVKRTRLPRVALIRIAATGALESLGLNARAALWRLLSMSFDEQSLLFGLSRGLDEDRDLHESTALPREEAWEQMRREYQSKGFSVELHPLKVLRPELARAPHRYQTAAELPRLRSGAPVRIAGLISLLQKPPTAKGMCFLSMEDETGLLNVVVTPDLYQKYRQELLYSPLLDIEGHIENRDGVSNLKAKIIRRVQSVSAPEAEFVPPKRFLSSST